MSERLSRPPVVLKGAQPDGSLNGLARTARHFLGPDFQDSRFLVVEVEREEKIHKDKSGADVAVLGIVRVAMPDEQTTLGQMLQVALDADFAGTIPAFPLSDYERYQAALDAWAEKKDYGPADVRKEWETHFGPEVPGPVGASIQHLVEFVLEVSGPLDDERDDPGPDEPAVPDEEADGSQP